MLKLRKGDEVYVMVGKDKGKKAKIEHIDTKRETVTLAGINVYKKHRKSTGPNNPSGIIEAVRPLSVAKVMIYCPKCNRPSRIGYVMDGDKKKRICRRCEQAL